MRISKKTRLAVMNTLFEGMWLISIGFLVSALTNNVMYGCMGVLGFAWFSRALKKYVKWSHEGDDIGL